jgi:hypothetical protein
LLPFPGTRRFYRPSLPGLERKSGYLNLLDEKLFWCSGVRNGKSTNIYKKIIFLMIAGSKVFIYDYRESFRILSDLVIAQILVDTEA